MSRSELNVDYKELAVTVRKLDSLLQDPEPGLFAWQTFFSQRCEELVEQLKGLGYVRD